MPLIKFNSLFDVLLFRVSDPSVLAGIDFDVIVEPFDTVAGQGCQRRGAIEFDRISFEDFNLFICKASKENSDLVKDCSKSTFRKWRPKKREL